MKIISRFRCDAVREGAYITLSPIGPPDGQCGVIVGTGRGPCELGKVCNAEGFAPGDEYEIVIQKVGKKDGAQSGQADAPGNDSATKGK